MPRIRLRLSLQMLLLAVTGFAIWLGMAVSRSERQRTAIAHFQAGVVIWDFQAPGGNLDAWDPSLPYTGPSWLRLSSGQGLFSRVRALVLAYGTSHEAFASLPDLPYLERLNLSGSTIDDEGMQYVSQLPRLTVLNLQRTDITDRGLAEIGKMTGLEYVSLDYCDLSDEGIQQLAALRKLRRLGVEATHVTADGARRLKEKLPECEIWWGRASIPQGDPLEATPRR